MHVEDENFIAQRVGYVNPLGRRINSDSGGAFEVSLAAFQGADCANVLSVRLEDEDQTGIRVGNVDVVLSIDRDALRRQH